MGHHLMLYPSQFSFDNDCCMDSCRLFTNNYSGYCDTETGDIVVITDNNTSIDPSCKYANANEQKKGFSYLEKGEDSKLHGGPRRPWGFISGADMLCMLTHCFEDCICGSGLPNGGV